MHRVSFSVGMLVHFMPLELETYSYRFAKFDLYQPIFVKVYVTLYFYVYHAHTMGPVFSPTSMFLFMVNCRYTC